MKYMGSKNRIAKHILPIMLKERGVCTWVEPFVGGANMIDKVEGERIGADLNPYLINALISIRDCLSDLPKSNSDFTEENYVALRKSEDYKYKGYAGFAFSFGGKWLGGWSRDGLNKRDYVNESYKNALKQSPKLKGVKLVHSSYKELDIPDNSLIYCDPPYENTTSYKDPFKHSDFWQWCRDKHKEGHKVFISEYNAPDDFECVWQGEIKTNFSSTRKAATHNATEKLFTFDELY